MRLRRRTLSGNGMAQSGQPCKCPSGRPVGPTLIGGVGHGRTLKPPSDSDVLGQGRTLDAVATMTGAYPSIR
jgi:hypothetical protein